MSRGLNKVQVIGHLGQDPEIRHTPGGAAVANIRVACSEQWTDRQSGEKKEHTEWVTVVIWGKLAEVCGEYLRKGAQVYFEGKLRTRKWADKQGNDRYSTEVLADQMLMLGGGGRQGEGGGTRESTVASARAQRAAAPAAEPDFDDSIPF